MIKYKNNVLIRFNVKHFLKKNRRVKIFFTLRELWCETMEEVDWTAPPHNARDKT